MTALTPPQPPPRWTHTPEDVQNLTRDAVAEYRAVLDRVAALKPEECTFESVFLTLANAATRRSSITEPLAFYQNVSPSKELRNASNAAETVVQESGVESAMRVDVFRAKQMAQKNIETSGRTLNPEEQRLVEKMILEGTRAGLALPDSQRAKLVQLQKGLSRACLQFRKNFNEENGTIEFTLGELKGVPTDTISGYPKRTKDNKEVYEVTYKLPDWGPILRFAENPETRRKAYAGYEDRLAINAPVLSNIFDFRRQIANLLGHASWADYVTEVKMVKTAKGVEEFLDDLEQRLRPIGVKDLEAFLEMKKQEHQEKGYPYDGELYAWDYSYYDRKVLERNLNFDTRLLKEYFPVSFVVPAILEIYQNLFEVKFIGIGGVSWHPEVQQFEVWERDAKDESDFLGYCYLDIYLREGKHSHASVWPILPGYERADGTRSYPVAAMVASFAKPTPEKPTLIGHFDVKMFFHEIGHVFHELLSRTRFARFHGTTVAGDFMEAPSQMLENWCYEPKVLTRMSSHYQTGKPLSAEFIDKIIESRHTNMGLFNLKQVSLAAFDLRAHLSDGTVDYTKLWSDVQESIALLKTDQARPGHGGFQHLVGDYSVGYYGYNYSLVFAADMYAAVFKDDPLDPVRGRRYREKILCPGSSKDEMDLLKDFLGREPSSEAFIEQLFGRSGSGSAA
ncbi:Metalloprotease [Trametes maxima]|nr:Metalloprotease [Trametes maxima]